ncbi:MAG: DUF3276 family protein [Candidatus Eremiobacteraeota bacterium]|jgi:hypothetical protein|nr:DUF3276 family protein [Candidatus Eremiobacteraeota bacterium]MCL5055530.1 DUF3276 family protein [Bacillota bacterium]
MSENGKVLFTRRISGGKNRNYFFDVRVSEKNGSQYLVLSESRMADGNWANSRILIFPDRLEEWKQTFEEALQNLVPSG